MYVLLFRAAQSIDKFESIIYLQISFFQFSNIYSNTLVHSSPHLPLQVRYGRDGFDYSVFFYYQALNNIQALGIKQHFTSYLISFCFEYLFTNFRTARVPAEATNQLPPQEFAQLLIQKLEKVLLHSVVWIWWIRNLLAFWIRIRNSAITKIQILSIYQRFKEISENKFRTVFYNSKLFSSCFTTFFCRYP